MPPRAPKGLHSAVVEFETLPVFALAKSTGAFHGLIDVSATILPRDAPHPVPPPPGGTKTKLHGVVWAASKGAWTAKTCMRGEDVLVVANTQQVAGMAYDAVSINARGPGGIAHLNYPDEIADGVFEQLGVTRKDCSDGMARFLLAAQFRAEGVAAADIVAAAAAPQAVGETNEDAASSAAGAAAEAPLGASLSASARMAAWLMQGEGGGVLAAPAPAAADSAVFPGFGGAPCFPGFQTAAEEQAALESNLEVARLRIAAAAQAGSNPVLGISVKKVGVVDAFVDFGAVKAAHGTIRGLGAGGAATAAPAEAAAAAAASPEPAAAAADGCGDEDDEQAGQMDGEEGGSDEGKEAPSATSAAAVATAEPSLPSSAALPPQAVSPPPPPPPPLQHHPRPRQPPLPPRAAVGTFRSLRDALRAREVMGYRRFGPAFAAASNCPSLARDLYAHARAGGWLTGSDSMAARVAAGDVAPGWPPLPLTSYFGRGPAATGSSLAADDATTAASDGGVSVAPLGRFMRSAGSIGSDAAAVAQAAKSPHSAAAASSSSSAAGAEEARSSTAPLTTANAPGFAKSSGSGGNAPPSRASSTKHNRAADDVPKIVPPDILDAAAGDPEPSSVGSAPEAKRFRGIQYRHGTGQWEAKAGYQSARISGGFFDSQAEAAHAYDRLLLRLRGPDVALALLNFPEERAAVWAQVEAELKAADEAELQELACAGAAEDTAAAAAATRTRAGGPRSSLPGAAAAGGPTSVGASSSRRATTSGGTDADGPASKRARGSVHFSFSDAAAAAADDDDAAAGVADGEEDEDEEEDAWADTDGLGGNDDEDDYQEGIYSGGAAGGGGGGGGGSGGGRQTKYGVPKYRGVECVRSGPNSASVRPWISRLCYEGKRVRVGAFAHFEAAARAYDKRTLQLRGEAGRPLVNFPADMPAVLLQIERDRAAGVPDAEAAVLVPGAPGYTGPPPAPLLHSSRGGGGGGGGWADEGDTAASSYSGGGGGVGSKRLRSALSSSSSGGKSAAAHGGFTGAQQQDALALLAAQLVAAATGQQQGLGLGAGGSTAVAGELSFAAFLQQQQQRQQQLIAHSLPQLLSGQGQGGTDGIAAAVAAATQARGASASSHLVASDTAAIGAAVLRSATGFAAGAPVLLDPTYAAAAAVNAAAASAHAAANQRMHAELLACTVAIGDSLQQLEAAHSALRALAPAPAVVAAAEEASTEQADGGGSAALLGAPDEEFTLLPAAYQVAVRAITAAHASLCAAAARNAIATSLGSQLAPIRPFLLAAPPPAAGAWPDAALSCSPSPPPALHAPAASPAGDGGAAGAGMATDDSGPPPHERGPRGVGDAADADDGAFAMATDDAALVADSHGGHSDRGDANSALSEENGLLPVQDGDGREAAHVVLEGSTGVGARIAGTGAEAQIVAGS